jgi:methyl-accepting chemotaxis protein
MKKTFDDSIQPSGYLDKLTIKNRLNLITLIVGLMVLLVTTVLNAWSLNENLFQEAKIKLSNVVDNAESVVKMYQIKVKDGDLTLAEAQKQAKHTIQNMQYDGDNYIWVNDYEGIMLVHPKAELIGTNILNMEDSHGKKFFQELISATKDKGSSYIDYYWSKPGEDKNKSFPKLSYTKGDSEWGWIIGSGVYIDNIEKQLFQSILRSTLISILIVIFIIIIINLTIGRSIIKPLETLTNMSLKLAENDLTISIPNDANKTEIGDLNRSFKKFVENFQNLIGQVSKSVEEVSASSEEMSAVADQTAQGSQQTAVSVSQLASGSQEQAFSVNKSLENVNHINTIIKKIYTRADKTVELSNTTDHKANDGYKEAEKAVKKINQIKYTSTEISQTINQLGKLSSEIEIIVELIKGIAGQTNLLALNAAIEAARAGEHGKGFAVVADEVKKLAAKSSEATDKITGMIKEIQSKTNTAVITMDESVQEIEEGVIIVDNVGSTLKEILDVANKTSEEIKEISNEINELATNSDSVVKMMENISSVTEESAAGAEEISSIAEEQTASMEEISASSQALAKIAENLRNLVSIFKI